MAYKIIDRCVCCHTCATNCPVEAITFQGSQYWIDPEVCISCARRKRRLKTSFILA